MRTVLACALAFSTGCSCGTKKNPAYEEDAGTGPDGGGGNDSGTGDDAGGGNDAGGGDDAGASDAGVDACVANCGDGVITCAEICDDGVGNSDVLADACRTDCTPARCGDGVIDWGLLERCDDGGVAVGDGCDAGCQIEATASCGDGVVDYDVGEECDDANAIDADGCTDCLLDRPAGCGDGALDLIDGEECDDGNVAGGDGCGPTCQLEVLGATCGDDVLDRLEACDDGNVANGDGCNPTCNLANTTSLFVGQQGNPGNVDGIGGAAQIGGLGTLAVDADYLYFSDSPNNVIRRIEIDTADVVTIAGTGAAAYGDNADGLLASFFGVSSLATDGVTLWAGDAGNRRLRAIDLTDPNFAVTTVAGSGVQNHTDGVGAAAEFDDLRGATWYAGIVYMLDSNAATLRSFDPGTQQVTTIAGSEYAFGSGDANGAAARFQSPRYMTSDNSGMLYIADTNGAKIRAYNTVTGDVTTFAGTGVAGYVDGVGAAAEIHRPRGMASDGGSIYWVEFDQNTVRQGIVATQQVSTNVGTECWPAAPCPGYMEDVGTAALFDSPFGLAYHWPSSSLFVVDGGNEVIRRIQ